MGLRTQSLTFLGLLAGLTAMLQLGPVWLPGAGHLLAVCATLPAAVAGAAHPARSSWYFLAAAVAVGLVSPQEMGVYITLTGPLGLMLGLTCDRPTWFSAGASAAVLTGGLLLLPVLTGVYPWGGLERSWPTQALLSAYGAFALVYAALWQVLFRRLWSKLRPRLVSR